MIWFIAILLGLGILALIAGFTFKNVEPERDKFGDKTGKVQDAGRGNPVLKSIGAVLVIIALIIAAFSSFYTQDAGEAKVQKDITGNLVGQTTSTGLHFKAPWVSTTSFDIRNNTVTYVGKGEEGDHSGGSANGPQITFQDREGVTGNFDVVVRYSLKPDSVLDIYREFQTQENFVNRVIQNDVRSTLRNVPSQYGTIEVYNSRADIEAQMRTALEKRWADAGIIVEEVSLQEIRYSDDVKARFDEAQASRIAESKAQADLEVSRVTAEQKRVEAQGVADANAILTQSLTPEVLQQKYIDAISNGKATFVVPEGSNPLIQVPSGQ